MMMLKNWACMVYFHNLEQKVEGVGVGNEQFSNNSSREKRWVGVYLIPKDVKCFYDEAFF